MMTRSPVRDRLFLGVALLLTQVGLNVALAEEEQREDSQFRSAVFRRVIEEDPAEDDAPAPEGVSSKNNKEPSASDNAQPARFKDKLKGAIAQNAILDSRNFGGYFADGRVEAQLIAHPRIRRHRHYSFHATPYYGYSPVRSYYYCGPSFGPAYYGGGFYVPGRVGLYNNYYYRPNYYRPYVPSFGYYRAPYGFSFYSGPSAMYGYGSYSGTYFHQGPSHPYRSDWYFW